jgi:putative transposase
VPAPITMLLRTAMPRIPRGQMAGQVYHVINRGNGGTTIFHKDGDYRAFLNLLVIAKRTYAVNVFGFCLMPNHFHLVLQPAGNDALGPFMQWWMTSHVRRYHYHYRSHGHVWQGRFKSFPIQHDDHFLTVIRYVVRNPVRAGLVAHSHEWPWSSLHFTDMIDPWPVERPMNVEQWVNEPLFDHELCRLRQCVNRQAPFGTPVWQQQMSTTFGLESTLRPRGRPRKAVEK